MTTTWYCPGGSHESGWLGYYIGENTHLKDLTFYSNPFQGFDSAPFYQRLSINRSIQTIRLSCSDLMGGEIFQYLSPFLKNNNSVSEIEVEVCGFGAGSAHQLSLALRECSKSMKRIRLSTSRELSNWLI